ncbi:MAG: UDP-N-acetylmuramoyl-tripeptide--D-alanyl-D-alanine ligase [Burkholderiales bacterium]|jgi:UDP-N-acetylmuramoyl-tripeptide--D-alanyl-D-alanine ligase|nr:UDP-N-acetylmuramoyl-tripeptide--D-alanyl-D-alanine ligase [Burkholderiales bacterium]
MELTLIEIAQMCDGELSSASNKKLIINDAVIDSRKAIDNTLFIAIIGEKQDAHNFVFDLCHKNTQVACLVSKNQILKLANAELVMKLPNLIYVEDTIKALGKLASNYRQNFNIPVVGITGSNGKTTVKEMLKSICENQLGMGHVLATEGNLNNHLGVPLTLLKINSLHKVAIIEMGMNHARELDYLSSLAKPTVALVNNVLLAHAGFFNAIEDIARAKAEIYHGLSAGGIACINKLEPLYPIFEENIAPKIECFYYGDNKTRCYITAKKADGSICVATYKGNLTIKLQVIGEHNEKNALSAIALALNLNCDLINIEKGLNNYKGFARRLEQKTAFNGALLIDDSYNANPASVKAAIQAIEKLPKPHWLILADLKELGKFENQAHQDIGLFAYENRIDRLLTIGELAAIANKAFSGEKLHFATNQDIVKYCINNLPEVATLLIKGSLSTNLKEVVNSLLLKQV